MLVQWQLDLAENKDIVLLPSDVRLDEINFTDLKSIINTIKNEEKKIGTIQKEVAEETKKCMVNNKDWLNVKFWEK